MRSNGRAPCLFCLFCSILVWFPCAVLCLGIIAENKWSFPPVRFGSLYHNLWRVEQMYMYIHSEVSVR